ncbi:UNVERIFIED_CONTAM: hypothetical protein PYX00_004677 [Menopon gallinae]|uniref:[histone H3]-trimethyl-L-lysine(4) demethylase n=1 Tax=Menopon gallinae TaxID=328185 RepID=A0AAW2I4P3_9NEOP
MVYKTEKSPTKSPNKGLGLSPLMTDDFHFIVPPEAPTYTPDNNEFQDPLAYIAKIRPEAEKYGICKIKPPPDWQPPFAVDVDRFKFTPRIQRLNELEAKTRIKLNFLDQIAKFWELQGSSLKIPMVERRALDLYALHRFVEEEGGFYGATTNRKWSKIASRMGFPTGRDLGSVLKHHYERILHPFDIFKQGKTLSDIKSEKEEGSDCDVTDSKKKEKDYKPHGIVSRQAIKPPVEKYARRSKRCFENKSKQGEPSEQKSKSKKKEVKKISNYEYDPLAKYVCHNCERGDAEENMLLCDGCDDSYHTFCLLPPLTEIPKGDWRCPKCVAAEVSKPMEAFGFEQARREYTLQQFGEMADQFKSDYFNMPVHMVPSNLIEKEFWRIVSSIDEDVTVEYGADLHTMDHGSGFPTKISVEEMATCEVEYAKSRWNLNNLPCLENSVLGHINADISGMKVPWMYVGMCFATFCWHNEDHWSYSINYLHWGEAKTWYGVPGEKAEDFELAMKKAAPELFQSQPDLLHQLVTIMNPNILMDSGVPVYRTDQEAGEFVITFPRAYHAGFNQGYNFAEAVNFAPADWLSKGRECIDHYSMLRRYCVFSHDELVCKMASCPNSLDLTVATATFQDMTIMVQTEKKLRKSLLEWGVTEAEREAFELLPDDERQCEVCKTTCFLSAVTCSCSEEQLVCLRHCTELCKCPPENHKLRYRYTLDELPVMLEKLKLRVECYDMWCEDVTNALDRTKEKTLTLPELKALLNTAIDKKFPITDLLESLKTAVEEAEKCATVAQQLANKKLRTRTRQTSESKYKLTVEELTLFYEEIENLHCVLKETDTVKDLLDKVKEFQNEAKKLLDLESADSVALEKCIDAGVMLDVELPELVVLKQNLQRITWLEEVAETKEDEDEVTLEVLRSLLDAGVELPPHPLVEKEMADLQQLFLNVEKWEEKAKEYLNSKQRQPISALEKLLKEGEELPAFLPSEAGLRDTLKKAKDWLDKVEAIENAPDFPYLDTLEGLVSKGRHIAVKLDVLSVFESKLENAKAWKERTARTFLRKNSRYTLMEALSPRTEFGINVLKMKKKKPNEENSNSAPVVYDVKLEGNVSPVAVVAAFKHAERQEMSSMRDLRLQNLRKRASDKNDIKYCICRRGATGFMLQCELCKDWFHAACVPLPKNAGG